MVSEQNDFRLGNVRLRLPDQIDHSLGKAVAVDDEKDGRSSGNLWQACMIVDHLAMDGKADIRKDLLQPQAKQRTCADREHDDRGHSLIVGQVLFKLCNDMSSSHFLQWSSPVSTG